MLKNKWTEKGVSIIHAYLVWMRISALPGLNMNLQMSSWVTGIAVVLDTHRSDK